MQAADNKYFTEDENN